MICGALQTLNEEAMEDVLQSEPPAQPGEPPLLPIRENSPPAPSSDETDAPSSDEQTESRRDHVVLTLSDDVFL